MKNDPKHITDPELTYWCSAFGAGAISVRTRTKKEYLTIIAQYKALGLPVNQIRKPSKVTEVAPNAFNVPLSPLMFMAKKMILLAEKQDELDELKKQAAEEI